MGLLSAIIGSVVGLFVRKVTTVDPSSGDEITRRRPTGFGMSAAGVIAFLLLYHLLLWPILNYHFPQYAFPPLDLSVLGAVLPAIGGI